MRFPGKVCLVTGATSGIGLATAELFAREGACVSIVGHDEEHGKAALERVRAQHAEAVFAQADVADPAQAEAAVRKTVEQWGKIDVLVNNAAMMTFAPVVELSPDDWDRVLAVNLRGVFLFAKFSIPHMPPGSSIVNVSSVHAHETTVNVAPYAASKGGMEAFSRALSRELGAKKIRVNCVAPGPVWTPLNPSDKRAEEVAEFGADTPMKRPAQPEEIAPAFVFFASEADSSYVTGEVLTLLGGETTAG